MNQPPLIEAFKLLNSETYLLKFFDLVREEDLQLQGDVTSKLMISETANARARIFSKANAVLCGVQSIPYLLRAYRSTLSMNQLQADGDKLNVGQTVLEFHGSAREILAIERPALNLLSRLSGISSLTEKYVLKTTGSKTKIYDTRKTTPGLRGLEKYAVRCGGGYCHRMGLHDAVLVKDNHLQNVSVLDLQNILSKKLRHAREQFKLDFIEVEVDTLAQLEKIIDEPTPIIDMVLLDNMSNEDIEKAVTLRNQKKPGLLLEASGGIHLERISLLSKMGVDRISVGALTHSAPAVDFSMEIEFT